MLTVIEQDVSPEQPKKSAGPLPGGAQGIEFGDFAISFQADKVIFFAKSSNEHYTVHMGRESKVLDIHRTVIDSNGLSRHETVYAIKQADLERMLLDFGSTMPRSIKLFRRLRIGWLARNRIAIAKGLEHWTDEQILAVSTKNRRKRLVVDPEKLLANIIHPEYLDAVWDWPDGWFSLFFHSRRIGLGIKLSDRASFSRLFWVRLRDLSRFTLNNQRHLMATAKRYAIPKDQYERYNIARRS
jgi:hypothetical protein